MFLLVRIFALIVHGAGLSPFNDDFDADQYDALSALSNDELSKEMSLWPAEKLFIVFSHFRKIADRVDLARLFLDALGRIHYDDLNVDRGKSAALLERFFRLGISGDLDFSSLQTDLAHFFTRPIFENVSSIYFGVRDPLILKETDYFKFHCMTLVNSFFTFLSTDIARKVIYFNGCVGIGAAYCSVLVNDKDVIVDGDYYVVKSRHQFPPLLNLSGAEIACLTKTTHTRHLAMLSP